MFYKNPIKETEADDVDLSSFELKPYLNKKFWNGGSLDILARRKMLTIARDFIKKFDIVDFQVEDVLFMGSLANYNWNEDYSDIDLHIVIDFSEINDDVNLVEQFFDAVKTEWNKKHDNIKIYGYPVEVYVQDANADYVASGVYSVLTDEWIKEPSYDEISDNDVDEEEVKETVADFMDKIDEIEENYLLTKDGIGEDKLKDILDDAESLYDDIKKVRRNKFSKEMTNGNLIFKSLRRNGYIGKLRDIKLKIFDLIHSL